MRPTSAAAYVRNFPVTAGIGAPEIYKFDITPSGGTIALADRFTLNFPANAVCDPSSSSYGVGHWDEDCTPTTKTISVTAKVWVGETRLLVDFSPNLRFVPSANVTISTDLLAPILAGRTDLPNGALSKYELLYSSDLGSSTRRETIDDSTVKTYIDLTTGRVWRRLKHFSGYVTVYGEPCTPAYEGDPDCVWSDEGGVEGHQ
jgi:hypothetical protein